MRLGQRQKQRGRDMRSMRAAAFGVALGAGAGLPGGACAQTTLTRTSSFAYSASTGLLTQEVIEPNDATLKLQTDYGYDSFGNKTSVTVSGAGITTRTSSASYDSNGRFQTGATNALSQSESWEYDVRFGKPTSRTGPHGIDPKWTYARY